MSDIPVCQNCGKKLYKNYGSRGYLATPDHQYYNTAFNTEEERNNYERDELPENVFRKFIALFCCILVLLFSFSFWANS